MRLLLDGGGFSYGFPIDFSSLTIVQYRRSDTKVLELRNEIRHGIGVPIGMSDIGRMGSPLWSRMIVLVEVDRAGFWFQLEVKV